jgi:hypothetical protein
VKALFEAVCDVPFARIVERTTVERTTVQRRRPRGEYLADSACGNKKLDKRAECAKKAAMKPVSETAFFFERSLKA